MLFSVYAEDTILAHPCSVDVLKTVLAPSVKKSKTSKQTPFDHLINSKRPVVFAHGKNENIAIESTWLNIEHSLKKGDGWIGGLEVDAMPTKDGKFIIMHDPTFHNLVKNYQTVDYYKLQNFLNEYPELAKAKKGDWDFNLFDDSSIYTLGEIKAKFKIFDPKSGYDFNFITLDELLSAAKNDKTFVIPPYTAEARAAPAISNFDDIPGLKEKIIHTQMPTTIYIDFKAINNLPRRLYNLSDWNWIKNSWSLDRLTKYTSDSLKTLSDTLKRNKSYDKTFFAVRHPDVAKMSYEIDPRMHFMASPESIVAQSPIDFVIGEFEKFKPYKPQIYEVKYLAHITDPKLRAWAKSNKVKLLFNHIEQGDKLQFEGQYWGNTKKLLDDLLKDGDDLLIQTNHVQELKNLLNERP